MNTLPGEAPTTMATISEARCRCQGGLWCQPARGCHLPSHSRRQRRARRWTAPDKYTLPLRQGGSAAGQRFLVDDALRCGRAFQIGNTLNRYAVSSWMLPAMKTTRTVRSTCTSSTSPGRWQGGQLAACSKGPYQSDHAPLRPEERGPDRQMEPAAGHEGTGSRLVLKRVQ